MLPGDYIRFHRWPFLFHHLISFLHSKLFASGKRKRGMTLEDERDAEDEEDVDDPGGKPTNKVGVA